MKKIFFICLIIVVSLMVTGCVNNNQERSSEEVKTVDKTNNLITPTPTPKVTATLTINPTQNKYKTGDVISAFKDPNQIPNGWVISKYDNKNDLYYGYRASYVNGAWKRSETKEWDLWNKKQTETDFPYLQGHISL